MLPDIFMQDTIYRKDALAAVGEVHPLDYNAQATANRIKALPSAGPSVDVVDVIQETLAIAGVYGEERAQAVIDVLKRLGRYDLLPPCCRE